MITYHNIKFYHKQDVSTPTNDALWKEIQRLSKENKEIKKTLEALVNTQNAVLSTHKDLESTKSDLESTQNDVKTLRLWTEDEIESMSSKCLKVKET